MSVILYKAGNTHIIDGIECEMKVFDEFLFASNLDIGWCLTPAECYKTKPLNDSEIRASAKEKGIKNWYNKKIDRLRKEVDECQI